MDYCKSILICGGDKRQKCMYRQMLADGLNVKTYALGCDASVCQEDIDNFDVVIFPVPVSTDGINLNAPLADCSISIDDILHRLSKTQTVLGGMCDKINFDMTDYYKNEKLQTQNAIPTAEGAMRIAMENSDFTLYGSRCLVIGYGRIGKLLAKRLTDMGAEVTVCARKEKDLALAESFGCKVLPLEYIANGINSTDIIFNTVPKVIITADMVGKIKKSTLYIELASKPYGIDMTTAKALCRRVIIASGLPGKFTPESSAKILKEIIMEILIQKEMEV